MSTLQLSIEARNAMLDAFETYGGLAAQIELRTGALPANCAAVSTGNLLARGSMPSDWMAPAAAGAKAKAGAWTLTGPANITTQNIGHFRMFQAGSPDVCIAQGDVTATGGGGAMTVDNISMAAGQVVTINSFTLTAGNP